MHDPVFPPRIESAFRVLAYAHSVESGGSILTPRGPQAIRPRTLSPAESALRNSAAEVLRNYITGEVRIPRPRASSRTLAGASGTGTATMFEHSSPSEFDPHAGFHGRDNDEIDHDHPSE
jgi:hypothetical protein